ncbi:MAG: hypothetical protein WCS87_15020 [Methylococcaceae bacterium]
MKLQIGVPICAAIVVIGWLVFSYVNNSNSLPSNTISKSAHVLVSTFPEIEAAQPKSNNISLAEGMMALRQEVIFLRREVANIQMQLHSQPEALVNKARASKEPDARKMSAKDEKGIKQERTEALEAAFAQESIDQKWANEAVRAIKDALAQEDMGQLVLQSLVCRSNTCRIELDNNKPGDISKSLPLFMQRLSEIVPNVTADEVEDSTGGTSLVFYMSQDTNDSEQ